ncbi:TetR/AcrR family transcriptional regulator [Bradyrhizobium sp. Cp5.3]|uniref:TetR/AcrR family transcriptional regulator n=1 Tax=Bradyrhizobium sp. Cp5.3 TaxID=443598 RepID=UPI0006844855|nr:TetR/AcrR family transcriptional regulator [Bradyrhizobium sp. Cp5.3]
MDGEVAGRPNQRKRTRKDLLDAATRLVKQGRKPTLEEIAEAALVSRATAYRYFPNVEALLLEASFDIAVPDAADLFHGDAAGDPVARVQQVDTALHDMILANEAALRMMLVHSLQHAMGGSPQGELPVRQNRRMPLIEAALNPSRHQFKAGTLETLSKALALIVGTEGVIAIKDVLQLDDAEARAVKRWAIRALIEAAMSDTQAKSSPGTQRDRSTSKPRARRMK